jgi:regulator of protease activity HflC (stomatin/prohibitin superfamily)
MSRGASGFGSAPSGDRALHNVVENIKYGMDSPKPALMATSPSINGASSSGSSGGLPPPPPPRNDEGPTLQRVDNSDGGSPLMDLRDFGLHDAVSDRLATGIPHIDQLLVQPNVDANRGEIDDQICAIVNVEKSSATQWPFGTVIEPGKLGIIVKSGKVEVVGQGRWTLATTPRASWAGIVILTDTPIKHETLTIVRVPRGQYGLAFSDGKPQILAEGMHVRNSRLFQYIGAKESNQKHIQHSTIHILIVPANEYALVVETNVPKILKSGVYVIDSAFFTVSGFVPVNREHIEHHTLHIVRVPKGKVALIAENNKYAFLPQGTYSFNSQVFHYSGLKDLTENCITHGTITRFRIRNGELGLAWHNNKPIFVDQPDFYEIDSPNFTFVRCVPASEKHVTLGSRKRVIVYDGEVGISYANGRLDVLKPKTHVYDDPERTFFGFLSTRQQSLYLVEDESKDHFLRCDTKDFVEVGIKACVFYKISDPEKGLMSVGDEKAIAKLIKDTSIATLQSIMRSSGLNQVAQSKHVHAGNNAKAQEEANAKALIETPDNDGPSAPLFFDKVHDEFIFHLHDTFYKTYGIEIANIRIESFKIMNHALADNISQQAIITAQTETKLANLEGQHEIATAEMQRETEVIRIKSQAYARQLATEAEARNSSIVADAKGKAMAAKIVAQGEADSLLIKAEAEAKAIELKAAAERKRAEELSATPLGEKLALMGVQSAMVTESLKGVQKIIYLPSNANLAQMPIQLFGNPGAGISPLEDAAFESSEAQKSEAKPRPPSRSNAKP